MYNPSVPRGPPRAMPPATQSFNPATRGPPAPMPMRQTYNPAAPAPPQPMPMLPRGSASPPVNGPPPGAPPTTNGFGAPPTTNGFGNKPFGTQPMQPSSQQSPFNHAFSQPNVPAPPGAGPPMGMPGPPRGAPMPGPPRGGPMPGPPRGPMPGPPNTQAARGPPSALMNMMGGGMVGSYGAPPKAGVSGAAYTPQKGYTGRASHPTSAAPQPAVKVEESFQCSERYMRLTTKVVPKTAQMAKQSQMPMGCVIRPLAPAPSEAEEVPVVNFGACGVVRCKRCRAYINPFVTFMDHGRRWKCNICSFSNDVPSAYFCHVGKDGRRTDLDERPELKKGQVEIVAPAEYMVRPPQAPAYMFVIDVSYNALSTGMLKCTVEAIKESLDKLPGTPRTQIGFITFDSSVHFYNLKPQLKQPQMLVVSEVNDVFLPAPDDLLVNLKESRHLVDALLDQLPSMFEGSREVESVMGTALQSAFQVMHHIGGKLCLFQTSIPSLGLGKLKHRDNPRIYGTEEERKLLLPSDSFYKTKAVELSRQQISVSLYLFASQYQDVATLSALPRQTGGQLYYYPNFSEQVFGEKFVNELKHDLCRITGFEAVMRVRCAKGMSVKNFHGNFFIRGTDLLALPNVTEDSTFTVGIKHEQPTTVLDSRCMYVQSALLYTTSFGERRIRVNTIAAPVSSLVKEVVESVDLDALICLIGKDAVDTARLKGLPAARQRLNQQCLDILRGTRKASNPKTAQGQYNQSPQRGGLVPVSDSLKMLPLYLMSMEKNATFRGGNQVSADMRAFYLTKFSNLRAEMTRIFVFPQMFALHTMPPACGLKAAEGERGLGPENIKMPAIMNLSITRMTSDGCYLMDDGTQIFLWLGRACLPEIAKNLFGLETLDGVDCTKLQLLPRDNAFSQRVAAIIRAIRFNRGIHQHVQCVQQGAQSEAVFAWRLVEDRANYPGGARSYQEYAAYVQRTTQLQIPH
eukprot:g5150.t1